MASRDSLPQLDGDLFLTDGGIETTLIFHRGLDLPLFAAFALVAGDERMSARHSYNVPFVEHTRDSGTRFVLESPTSRASPR